LWQTSILSLIWEHEVYVASSLSCFDYRQPPGSNFQQGRMSADYEYEPLSVDSKIRLLRLEPGKHGRAIHVLM
jgi:hypothetical protein